MRLRRAEEIETLSYRTVVELNADSRLALQRRVTTSLAAPNVPSAWLVSGPAAPSATTSSAPPAATAANAPAGSGRRRGAWWPMPDRPTLPEPTSDPGARPVPRRPDCLPGQPVLRELARLMAELPEPTWVALMHELSERGSTWAHGQWPRNLRTVVAAWPGSSIHTAWPAPGNSSSSALGSCRTNRRARSEPPKGSCSPHRK